MKYFLVLTVFLSMNASFAGVAYSNLPQVSTSVVTRGTRIDITEFASKLKIRHAENESVEIEKLKVHIEVQLKKQIIEAKCEPFKGFDKWSNIENSYIQGLESKCSVSFL